MQDYPDQGEQPSASKGNPKAEDFRGLMEEIREGSAQALQELVDRLWPELVRFAVWEHGDPDFARDAVQDAFIDLWSRRRSWVTSGSPRSYLYRVVRHQVLDAQRRRKVRESWATRERLNSRKNSPCPDEVLAGNRAEDAFVRAVDALPPRRRQAFNLVILRGLTYREAADVLAVSEQTVANHVSKGLSQVREAMSAVTGKEI